MFNFNSTNQNLTNATIMIVDDEPINIAVVQAFLEDYGYQNFITVEDSTQALSKLEECRPDLILLDLMMPEVSGFEILEQARNLDNFKHLPIIILTASSDTENKLNALELGATDFLAKPLDQSELALRVRNTLQAKAYQDQLTYFDPLTKLPNRLMFQEDLDWAVKSADRHSDNISLLSIEIDKFDKIHDSLGPHVGDELLQITAQRIGSVIRDTDILSRFDAHDNAELKLFKMEGSVFSVILNRTQSPECAALVSRRILDELKTPIIVADHEIYFTGSIGIATYPSEAEDSNALQQLTLSAKDYAKGQGGDRFQFSSSEFNSLFQERLNLEKKLRKALNANEFQLYYQPKVDIPTGRIVGVEALIRLVSDGEIISPGEFIPLAEETGLIIPIGKWCLMEGCRQLKHWHSTGHDHLSMSVNISARQFADNDFIASILEIISNSGIDPRYLTLELTESLLIDDVEEKIRILASLKEFGVKLSIDDFGTGYSSFNYLRQLPVDELKIDRSFIMEITRHANSRAIVATIIYLSRELGLLTVAEGIEEEEELAILKQLDCPQYQGFYFSRPVPHQQLTELLDEVAVPL